MNPTMQNAKKTMKTTFLKAAAVLVLSATIFTSCEKNESEPTTPSGERKMSMKELVSNPQFVAAYKKMEDAYKISHPESRVEFIAPFFTNEGFGLAQNVVPDPVTFFPFLEGQFAFFMSEMDGNDFYRRNNDGTVTVQKNSNHGYVDHYDYATGVYMFTESGHVSMNYTGPVISFDITDEFGNVIFTLHFIDYGSNPNAVNFQGNGQVRENGTGPQHNLVGRMVANPGWTQTNIGFNLN
jgi:hypothetical protein